MFFGHASPEFMTGSPSGAATPFFGWTGGSVIGEAGFSPFQSSRTPGTASFSPYQSPGSGAGFSPGFSPAQSPASVGGMSPMSPYMPSLVSKLIPIIYDMESFWNNFSNHPKPW